MNDNTNLQAPRERVLLKIKFDADQDSQQLDYQLVRTTSGTPNPNPDDGFSAGSLYFGPGEEVGLQVTGTGCTEGGFDSFQIVSCAFITRPQVARRGLHMKTQFSSPSPFLQAVGAVHPLALDFHATVDQASRERLTLTHHWKPTLNVGHSPGAWDLSFVMTVRITRGEGAVSEVRVFAFDPESEVGTTGTLKG